MKKSDYSTEYIKSKALTKFLKERDEHLYYIPLFEKAVKESRCLLKGLKKDSKEFILTEAEVDGDLESLSYTKRRIKELQKQIKEVKG